MIFIAGVSPYQKPCDELSVNTEIFCRGCTAIILIIMSTLASYTDKLHSQAIEVESVDKLNIVILSRQ